MSKKLSLTTVSPTEIEMTRRFSAPAERVFDAFHDGEIAKKWMSAKIAPISECKIDARPGGTGRYVWDLPEGQKMGMTSTFLEVERPVRTVHREVFDQDWTGGPTEVTTTFEETDGSTLVRTRVVYSSQAARDTVISAGMTDGMEETYEKLDALLAG